MQKSLVNFESIDDCTYINCYVKYDVDIDLQEMMPPGSVVLVVDALRKVSNRVEIYFQTFFNEKSMILLGKVGEQIADFQAN